MVLALLDRWEQLGRLVLRGERALLERSEQLDRRDQLEQQVRLEQVAFKVARVRQVRRVFQALEDNLELLAGREQPGLRVKLEVLGLQVLREPLGRLGLRVKLEILDQQEARDYLEQRGL